MNGGKSTFNRKIKPSYQVYYLGQKKRFFSRKCRNTLIYISYYNESTWSQNPQLHIPKNSDHQSQNNQFLYKDLQLCDICSFSSVCYRVQRFCSNIPQIKCRICLFINFSNDCTVKGGKKKKIRTISFLTKTERR